VLDLTAPVPGQAAARIGPQFGFWRSSGRPDPSTVPLRRTARSCSAKRLRRPAAATSAEPCATRIVAGPRRTTLPSPQVVVRIRRQVPAQVSSELTSPMIVVAGPCAPAPRPAEILRPPAIRRAHPQGGIAGDTTRRHTRSGTGVAPGAGARPPRPTSLSADTFKQDGANRIGWHCQY